MGITLGTNVSSLIVNGNLDSSVKALTKTMERLSSGLKINNSSDDAAGYVISQNMEAQIRSSNQAMQNIQTAESFLKVAEDGMVSVSDHMQRINDLLTNMANDTNDLESRTASIDEIIERLDEINRLSDSITFNGRKIIDGTEQDIYVQMGTDSTSDSVINIGRALTDCHIWENALDIELPDELNPYLYEKVSYTAGGAEADIEGPLYQGTYNNKPVYFTSKVSPENPTPDYYTINKNDDGTTTIQKWKYDSDEEAYVEDGAQIDTDANTVVTKVQHSNFEPGNENCRKYMAKVQEAISILAENRGLLGAYENRMQSSYASLATRVESLEEAKSLYTDTDVASTSTQYVNKQILEQMNVSLLASSNQMQALALSLLG